MLNILKNSFLSKVSSNDNTYHWEIISGSILTKYGNTLNEIQSNNKEIVTESLYKLNSIDNTYERLTMDELINPFLGYWLKVKRGYDYIIVGGGPAGIMTAFNISRNNPESNILLLEKADVKEVSLEKYKSRGYGELVKWFEASQSEFQYSFSSKLGENIKSQNLRLGKSLGGGTLHFGLQYIDSKELILKNHSSWEKYFIEVAKITGAQQYKYDSESYPNKEYQNLKEAINKKEDSGEDIQWCNNKIYSDDIGLNHRLLLGNLIENNPNNPNITIKYNSFINKINWDSNESGLTNYKARSIQTFDNEVYYSSNIILCAGAIQTPAILQRSGVGELEDLKSAGVNQLIDLPVGKTLFDHTGYTSIYMKLPQTVQTLLSKSTQYVKNGKNYGYNTIELTDINNYLSSRGKNLSKFILSDLDKGGIYNKLGTKMYRIFRHTKFTSNGDLLKAMNGQISSIVSIPIFEPRASSDSEIVEYVYDMQAWWNGTGHYGGTLYNKPIDLTGGYKQGIGHHVYDYDRLSGKSGKPAKLVGIISSTSTVSPTNSPTSSPTVSPTTSPTSTPTTSPTSSPTVSPTSSPTVSPTSSPTVSPTTSPTITPTTSPTSSPTVSPTSSPTVSPTSSPSVSPTTSPTSSPTISPTSSPTASPTTSPTSSPTSSPTTSPTITPTTSPTSSPTVSPSVSPTTHSTNSPTSSPTVSPTASPTTHSTNSPTLSPTVSPSVSPTASPTASPSKIHNTLTFDAENIVPHIQTRNNELSWQTYYSPLPNLNSIAITHATSSMIESVGYVKIKSKNNENPEVLIDYHQNGQKPESNLKKAFDINNEILTNLGYTVSNPIQYINETSIKDQLSTIYHYHGTCPEGKVVDSNFKVFNTTNVFIGDISVLNNPWGGSTSVPALVTGYICSENFTSNTLPNTPTPSPNSINTYSPTVSPNIQYTPSPIPINNIRKILCLHGGGGSGEGLRNQKGMSDLMNTLDSSQYDFIFPDTPEDDSVWIRDAPDGKIQGTDDEDWAKISISHLDEIIKNQGPFYALLGYSQGSAMSLVYLSEKQNEFKKVLLFNGYVPTVHRGLVNKIEKSDPYPINTSALIFMGKEDPIITNSLSLQLKEHFKNYEEIISTNAGHRLPYSSETLSFQKVINFITGDDMTDIHTPSPTLLNILTPSPSPIVGKKEFNPVDVFFNYKGDGSESPSVIGGDDGNTKLFCRVSAEIGEDKNNLIIKSNGVPNYKPTVGSSTGEIEIIGSWRDELSSSTDGNPNIIGEQNYIFTIPLIDPTINPINNTDDFTNYGSVTSLASIGVSSNGVPLYNPWHNMKGNYLSEDRDAITFATFSSCCGHPSGSGPGKSGAGPYHYHKYPTCIAGNKGIDKKSSYDTIDEQGVSGNIIYEQDMADILDDRIKNKTGSDAHSPIIGYMLDGYPIYGPLGLSQNEKFTEKSEVKILISNFKLNGNNYEFDINLGGDLDKCNAIYSGTPEYPDGCYHYVLSIESDQNGFVNRTYNPLYLLSNNSNDKIITPSYPYTTVYFRGSVKGTVTNIVAYPSPSPSYYPSPSPSAFPSPSPSYYPSP